MNHAVILDRDGTLIDFVRDTKHGVVTPAFHPRHVRFLPGVLEGLRQLQEVGFSLGIATNQPGAAKGELPREAIEQTNSALLERLADEGIEIGGLRACLHHPDGGDGGDGSLVKACSCRKPEPGLLTGLLADLGAAANKSWMIGDTATDMIAADRAGVQSALLMRVGRCELCPFDSGEPYGVHPTLVRERFDAVARDIVARLG